MPIAFSLFRLFFLQLFVQLKFLLSLCLLAAKPIYLCKTIVRLFHLRISFACLLIGSDGFWKVSPIRIENTQQQIRAAKFGIEKYSFV